MINLMMFLCDVFCFPLFMCYTHISQYMYMEDIRERDIYVYKHRNNNIRLPVKISK